MSAGLAVSLLRGGVLQTLMIAAPILLVGMLVGLIIAILHLYPK